MKTFIIVCLFVSTSLLAVSCKKDNLDNPDLKQVNLTEKQKQLVASSNAFGFDFFRKVTEVSGTNSNLMVSPLSVSMALGMTRNGAANSTLSAMTSTLGFSGMSEQEINDSYKYIVQTFASLDPKVKMQIANSIWYRNTFSVEQPFVQANQYYFDATVTPLDFSQASAVDVINSWVKEKTNSLIPKIIDGIPAEAVMYLVNAFYFKGQWKYQFDAKDTRDRTFYVNSGPAIQVPAMVQHATFNYFKGSGFAAIELPYNQGNYTLVVLLPDNGKSASDVISALTLANWNTWSRQFTETDIQLQLPKFKYEYEEKNMQPILTALGMGVAFDSDNADFTRINPNGGLYISKVLHKTFIETNEEGSEATAITAVEVGVTSIGPDQPLYFTVDRPFVYFIQEKSTGTILFIGTVMNPNS